MVRRDKLLEAADKAIGLLTALEMHGYEGVRGQVWDVLEELVIAVEEEECKRGLIG